jgi:high potential iron-sulfur protein
MEDNRMNEKDINQSRRDAVRLLLGGIAAAPLLNLVSPTLARAGDLPHLSEDDTMAKALHYVNDAAKGNRADKGGTPAGQQYCHNCRFVQADAGDWRPCQLFPGKAVNANGWCMSWTAKS